MIEKKTEKQIIDKACESCKHGVFYFYTMGDDPEYNGIRCIHEEHKYDDIDYDNSSFLYCKYWSCK
jgi:hypothetical protein